ncbi:hypothetical protein [Methylogaea oryzae]|uniref:Uncharacterized protein n=1 Tax=Methylogaea oryzae TaxID=1295382 RepID=A0A8D4VRT1_9GAMM|nr:hypothetical protein [Methylogaea oryzae]BBL71412.1 hypothetical protein MoryE10_20180 [Methylogaea oryzae]
MSKDKTRICNSTAEFLIFTGQAGEQSIEVRYEDETVWLTQKLMAELFAVSVPTINEHLKNIFDSGARIQLFGNSEYRIVQDRLFESDFDQVVKRIEAGHHAVGLVESASAPCKPKKRK